MQAAQYVPTIVLKIQKKSYRISCLFLVRVVKKRPEKIEFSIKSKITNSIAIIKKPILKKFL